MKKEIPFRIKAEFVNLLLTLKSFGDRHSRDRILDELPNIKSKANRGAVDRNDIMEIVNTALDMNSIADLISVIRFFEGESEPMKCVLEMVPNLLPIPGTDATPQNAYEIAMALNFDLNSLVTECLNEIWSNKGLIGFGVPCNLPVFLTNFCERIKREWGRSNVALKPILVINPINTSVDRAVLTVKNRYSPAMAHGDVMLPVQVNEQAMGELFWRKLRESFPKDENCENRFIVIIGMHEECVFPEELRN